MFIKSKEPEFTYFNEEWNMVKEKTKATPTDERGEYYDTDFYDGVDDYVLPKSNKESTTED